MRNHFKQVDLANCFGIASGAGVVLQCSALAFQSTSPRCTTLPISVYFNCSPQDAACRTEATGLTVGMIALLTGADNIA